MPTPQRVKAAICAALAARGDGVDAPAGLAERSALRGKSLGWLRADLTVLQKQAAAAAPAQRSTAAETLSYWLVDGDLTCLLSGLGRIGMSDAERADWDKFWAEVRATRDEGLKPPPREVKDK